MIKIDDPKSEVTIQGNWVCTVHVSTKKWELFKGCHYFYPYCGCKCVPWCSQLTTEIINQKQLQCTWQIAALPSLRGTCFIYTSSLVACWLITFQVQCLKVSCWHRSQLGFPSGSHTLGSRQKNSPCFTHAADNLHMWADPNVPWQALPQSPPVEYRQWISAVPWARYLISSALSSQMSEPQ